MSLKNWILHKMNGMANRVDLPRSPVLSAGVIRSPVVMRSNPARTTAAPAPGAASPAPGVRQYEVSLIGRWSELGSAEARASSRADALRTPLAGHGAEIAIEDAGGSR